MTSWVNISCSERTMFHVINWLVSPVSTNRGNDKQLQDSFPLTFTLPLQSLYSEFYAHTNHLPVREICGALIHSNTGQWCFPTLLPEYEMPCNHTQNYEHSVYVLSWRMKILNGSHLMIRYHITPYDKIYLLTAIGLTPGGSSTAHIYTHTIYRTTQLTQTIHRTTQLTNWEECGPCPHLCESYPGICLTTEEKAQKNLCQGSRRMPVGTMKTEYTEQIIH